MTHNAIAMPPRR